MSPAPPLPPLSPPPPWSVTDAADAAGWALLRLHRDGDVVSVELGRCAQGRLAAAYPVGARDVELRVDTAAPRALLQDLLRDLTTAVLAADPACRRVVYAADPDRPEQGAAAVAAGLRPVVEVDVPEPVELFAAEPAWVTRQDRDLDEVPGS